MISLHELSKVVKFIESESGMITRGWKKKEMRTYYLRSEHRVVLLQGEKPLEICCITMQIHSTLLNSTLKNGWRGKFCYVSLPQLEIKTKQITKNKNKMQRSTYNMIFIL